MAGSGSSVRGGHCGEKEAPVQRAELHQLQHLLLEVRERRFNERLPAAGGRALQHQHEEFGDENSCFGHGFHDRYGGGRDGHGGGRSAGHEDRRTGGDCGHGHRVRFDDEDESQSSHEEGYDDDENPFVNHGQFGHCQNHHHGAGHDGEHHHGRDRDDPDSIARVKLSVPKFLGKENGDAYLD
uniref:Uncharacterized protein n=1 Tax=Setaria viridis TaxID=4556 RepID=A0A4U6SZQ2_SETVI|nr:hypothetical protein SEVIR_9G307300v2 [Setaria viridis]